MIAIPVDMLPHSCIMRVMGQPDIFGDRQIIDEYLLERVRIVPRNTVKTDTDGAVYKNKGKMYFDCINSIPSSAEFLEDGCRDIILFEGREYAVTSVKKLYDEDKLHHLEIGLGEI